MENINYEDRENQKDEGNYYKKIVLNRKGQIGIAGFVIIVLVGIIVAVVFATRRSNTNLSKQKDNILTISPSEDIEVYAGVESFEVTCRVVSNDPLKWKLLWIDPKGKFILEGSGNPRTYAGPGNILTLQFVKPTVDHSGNYTCSYHDDAYQSQVAINFIDVSDKIPRFEADSIRVKSIEGTALLKVTCSAKSDEPIEYEWYDQKNDRLSKGITRWPYVSESGFVLNIPKAETRQTGLYSCNAKNKYGSARKTFEILIFKDNKPRIRYFSESVNVYENNELFLFCEVQGAGPLKYEWFDQGNKSIGHDNSSDVYVSLEAATITYVTIKSAKLSDEGQYRCVATNAYGSDSKLIKVSFYKDGTPNFQSYDLHDDKTVLENDTLSLDCKPDGAEPMKFAWYNQKNVLITDVNSPTINTSSLGSLIIESVRIADKGPYKCVANNTYGSATKTFNVSVSTDGIPKIILRSKNVTALENAELSLSCLAIGSLPMTFEWFNQKNQRLENDTSYRITTISSKVSILAIKSMKTSDQGEYRCVAGNSHGNATQRFYVSFSKDGAPKFKVDSKVVTVVVDSKLELQCQASGARPMNYTWYNQSDEITTSSVISTKPYGSYLTVEKAQMSDFRIYTCIAKNAHGLAPIIFEVQIVKKSLTHKAAVFESEDCSSNSCHGRKLLKNKYAYV